MPSFTDTCLLELSTADTYKVAAALRYCEQASDWQSDRQKFRLLAAYFELEATKTARLAQQRRESGASSPFSAPETRGGAGSSRPPAGPAPHAESQSFLECPVCDSLVPEDD